MGSPDADKRELFAKQIKKKTLGLVYIRFFFSGKNIRRFVYKNRLMHNIIDVYDLRKKLYRLRDVDNADYHNLLGQHISEFNYGSEEDIFFESNFESGNLFIVVKDN